MLRLSLQFLFTTTVLTAVLCVGGCPDASNSNSNSPPEPSFEPPGNTNSPGTVVRKTVTLFGGKQLRKETWYRTRLPDGRDRWFITDLQIVPAPNQGLAAGAQAAATSVGSSAGNSQPRTFPNAVLFAGGIGETTASATRQAYYHDFPADTWIGLEMTSARNGHTLTTLRDGRILIVGGWDGTSVPNSQGGRDEPALASTELFDPRSKTFQSTGMLGTGRRFHASAPLSDGRVLVTGGTDSTFGQLSSAEIYDPASGAFALTGSMSRPRSQHLAVALEDGRVLIVGGNAILAAEMFEPSSGTFGSVGNMTAAHGFGATATRLQNGKVLILGGNGEDTIRPSARAELFDPATNSFVALADMHTRRSTHFAILQDDGAVLIGGGTTVIEASGGSVSFVPTKSAESFDPVTNTFSVLDDLPTSASEGVGVFLER